MADTSELTSEQKMLLQTEKISTRINNEVYLRAHPEIKNIIKYLMRETLKNKPENAEKFAVGTLFLTRIAKEQKTTIFGRKYGY
jgi:hypothetical protein